MSEPIVCPACGARMRSGRVRCLRCRATMPTADAAAAAPARRRLPPWLTPGRLAAAVVGLAMLVVALLIWPRGAGADKTVVAANTPSPGPAAREVSVADPTTRARPAASPVADPAPLARQAYQHGNFQEAFDRYRTAVERNPGDAESWNNGGQMLVRLGRLAEAVPYFERAIALNEGRWAYHFNLAHACAALNQGERAVAEYRRAAALFPDDYATEYNLGMALHRQGAEAEAVEHFRRAVELKADEPSFYLSLGISNERLQRTADAVAAYEQYLGLASRAPDAGAVRARIEALSKTPAAARQEQ